MNKLIDFLYDPEVRTLPLGRDGLQLCIHIPCPAAPIATV